jgi:hypothetical protein
MSSATCAEGDAAGCPGLPAFGSGVGNGDVGGSAEISRRSFLGAAAFVAVRSLDRTWASSIDRGRSRRTTVLRSFCQRMHEGFISWTGVVAALGPFTEPGSGGTCQDELSQSYRCTDTAPPLNTSKRYMYSTTQYNFFIQNLIRTSSANSSIKEKESDPNQSSEINPTRSQLTLRRRLVLEHGLALCQDGAYIPLSFLSSSRQTENSPSPFSIVPRT